MSTKTAITFSPRVPTEPGLYMEKYVVQTHPLLPKETLYLVHNLTSLSLYEGSRHKGWMHRGLWSTHALEFKEEKANLSERTSTTFKS